MCSLTVRLLAAVCVISMSYTGSYGYSCNPPATFEDKIQKILDIDDSDGDGMITAKDTDRVLQMYDANGDCTISPYEWVSKWTCLYGDTPDKAHEIFLKITNGTDTMHFDTYRHDANFTRASFEPIVRNLYPEVSASE